jgi:hypothetical protein
VEADAESIRSAILLDEMEIYGAAAPGQGRIIVEVKTLNALAVLQYSCSIRVMALHTGEMNARRWPRPSPSSMLTPWVAGHWDAQPQGMPHSRKACGVLQAVAHGEVSNRGGHLLCCLELLLSSPGALGPSSPLPQLV